MNIIVQTTGVYASSINGKSESHNNNKLSNITKTLLLNSSQNKELWYFSMPEEVRNITTQSILSLKGETYGIMIRKTPKFFILT